MSALLVLWAATLPLGIRAADGMDGAQLDVLVARGSTWKYWDGPPGDVPPDWTGPGFDDSAWDAGPAPLGYGDGDEATVIGFGPDPDSKHLKAFFRLAFEVEDLGKYPSVFLDLQRDDAAVVYLNGVQVIRSRVSGEAVSPVADDEIENDYVRLAVGLEFLVDGRNVLAVELWQSDGSTSDASFDLEVLGALRTEALSAVPGSTLYAPQHWGDPMAYANRWTALAGRREVFLHFKNLETGSFDLRQTVVDPSPSDSSGFGSSLDMTDTYLAVGAHDARLMNGPQNLGYPGAVVIYRYDEESGEWRVDDRILPDPLPARLDNYGFGREVALSGTTLAVAAHEAVHIVRRIDGKWVESFVFADENPTHLDLSHDTLAVARESATVSGARWAGQVTLFGRKDDGSWAKVKTLTAPYPGENAHFGYSVAIDGRRMLVTALGEVESARHYFFYQQSLFGGWLLKQTVSRVLNRRFPQPFRPMFQGDFAAMAVEGNHTDGPNFVELFRWSRDEDQWTLWKRIHLEESGGRLTPEGPLGFAGGDLVIPVSGLPEGDVIITPVAGAVDIFSEAPSQAVAGQPYRYEVEGRAEEGGEPVFAVRNGPGWLRFVAGDGGRQALTGTPPVSAAGAYDVLLEARSAAGMVATQSFVLNVAPASAPPGILETPVSMRLVEGRPLVWETIAQGEGVLQYRWYRDGEELPNETGPRLERSAVTLDDAGVYRVEIANAFGSTWSEPAALDVLDVEFPARTFLVPGDYESLEPALANAGPGPWTILIQAGEHSGRFEINPYRIHLRGLDGADATVVRFISQSPTFTLIRGSILEGLTAYGIQMLNLEENVVIRDCVFEGTGGSRWFLNITQPGVVIARNRLRYSSRPHLFRIFSQASALIVNNQIEAKTSEAVFSGSTEIGLSVAHNNFVNCGELLLPGTEADWSNVVFENNILANFQAPHGRSTAALSKGEGFRGNLLWPREAPGGVLEDQGFLERGNLVGDPRFVDAGGGRFELWSDSPAIDSAVEGVVVEEDLFGNPRPKGSGSDRGAVEFQVEQGLPPIAVHPDSLFWLIFEDVDQTVPVVEITSPSGERVPWEVREKPAWVKLDPDRGETPGRALLHFLQAGPTGTDSRIVIGSGQYEASLSVRGVSNQYWSLVQWLEPNPVDGGIYTGAGGVFRIDPRTALLDGQALGFQSYGSPMLIAVNPLNGRMAAPRTASGFDPRFAVREPGADYFVPAGGRQAIFGCLGLAWVGADRVATIDTMDNMFVVDLGQELMVDSFDFDGVNNISGFAGDAVRARWWMSYTISGMSNPHRALSAFVLEDEEIRLIATHVEELAEWNPEPGPLIYDSVQDRVYWEGKIFDGDLTSVDGGSAGVLAVAPGSGIGFDASGALDLSTGQRLLAWDIVARKLAIANEGPGLLILTAAEPRLRLFPLNLALQAAEEVRLSREPAFLMRAVTPDQPGWTAVAFSITEAGVYRIQRSTDGMRWTNLTLDEELQPGWHARWVRSASQATKSPVLYRAVKLRRD
ncbi:MAG TPA: choice-of-anchor Q domain-containing protein [Verrucomicrobiales bacterium]|nr:choice-of-anchor Q domain-containing protein [Verrucomicrobiales bacterium]